MKKSDAYDIAIKRGGKCHSEKYINRLKTSKFPRGLELDIYYLQHGSAIEIQGIQHDRYVEFFHNGNPENFTKQQERNQFKKELCEENW